MACRPTTGMCGSCRASWAAAFGTACRMTYVTKCARRCARAGVAIADVAASSRDSWGRVMRDWMNDRFSRGRTISREAVVQTPLRLELRTANGHVSVRGIEGSSARVRAEIELKGFQ